MGHGSGILVEGVAVTVVPLGLTASGAWSVWRFGHRVGDSVSGPRPGRRPDRRRRARLDRPGRGRCFTARLPRRGGRHRVRWRRTAATAPVAGRVVGLVPRAVRRLRRAGDRDRLGPRGDLGGRAPALAAGRAAGGRPDPGAFLVVSTVVFLVALAARLRHGGQRDVPAAHGAGEATALHRAHRARWCPTRRSSPAPTCSAPASWSAPAPWSPRRWSRSARCRCSRCWPRCPTTARRRPGRRTSSRVPPLVAAVAAAWAQRRNPTLRWEEGALRGCAGGRRRRRAARLLAAVSGGAVGPGPDARRRPGRVRRAGARRDRLRHRRRRRRAGDDLVAAPPRPSAPSPRLRRVPPAAPLASSSWCPAPAPTSRRCSTPAPTRRTAPRWSPSAPTATASRGSRGPSGPASRPSCAGCRTSSPARSGTRALAEAVAAFEPDLVVLGRLHEAGRRRVPRPVRRTHGQHPPGAARRRSPGCTGPRRPGVRRQGHRRTLFVVDAGRRHRPDRRPDRGAGRATTTPPRPCTSGSRSPSARCWSTPSGRMAREGFTVEGRRVTVRS